MNSALKILILEDSLPDKELIMEQLYKAGFKLGVTHAENESRYTEARFRQVAESSQAENNKALALLRQCFFGVAECNQITNLDLIKDIDKIVQFMTVLNM